MAIELGSRLPIGQARQLNEAVEEDWPYHFLRFAQVKNRVLMVNPDIYIPLCLKKGKESPLGLFAKSTSEREPIQPFLQPGEFALTYWTNHQRSALLGRMIFSDQQGRFYRDIDLKGIGYLWPDRRGIPRLPDNLACIRKDGGREGLLEERIAFFDYQISEEFVSAGIRTHRVLAVIALDEVISDCKRRPLKQLVKSNTLPKNFRPVISVRAFGTKGRVVDISYFNKHAKLLLPDAQKLVSEETGNPALLDPVEYQKWFAETLGANVALMHHKLHYAHNYLTDHNITLDCRIVDLDSLSPFSNTDCNSDLRGATETLGGFNWDIEHYYDSRSFPGGRQKLIDLFQRSYDRTVSSFT